MAAAEEIEKLVIRLTGRGDEYRKMLEQATKDTNTYLDRMGRLHDRATGKYVKAHQTASLIIGRSMQKLGQEMTRLGRTLSLRLTAPLTILGGLAVRSFAQFDKAMTESIAIMDVTNAQIDRMRQLSLDLSTEAVQGPKELARAYFYLASAGKDAEQSMALLPQVIKFATAGAFDMAKATDLLTDAQSALGLTMEDAYEDAQSMARVSDVLVKANTLANATVEQFSTALTSKAGAALKAYNKDVEEGVAVLAALADQGVKAELAGNSLDRFLRLLSKTTLDNAAAHRELGFEVFDSTGKMHNFADIVGNLETILAGMSDQQKVVTLDMLGFQARVQQVILPLIGTSNAIREYESELRSAGGTTNHVAEVQMQSFSNRMAQVRNKLSVVAIDIGERLVPTIELLTNKLVAATEWWNRLDNGTKDIIITAALVVGALGPLTIALGTVTSMLGTAVALSGSFTVVAQTLAVVGVGALAAALWRSVSGISELNAEMARSKKLSEALLGIWGTRQQKFIAGAMQETDLSKRGKILEQETSATTRDISAKEQSIQKILRKGDKRGEKYTGKESDKRLGFALTEQDIAKLRELQKQQKKLVEYRKDLNDALERTNKAKERENIFEQTLAASEQKRKEKLEELMSTQQKLMDNVTKQKTEKSIQELALEQVEARAKQEAVQQEVERLNSIWAFQEQERQLIPKINARIPKPGSQWMQDIPKGATGDPINAAPQFAPIPRPDSMPKPLSPGQAFEQSIANAPKGVMVLEEILEEMRAQRSDIEAVTLGE